MNKKLIRLSLKKRKRLQTDVNRLERQIYSAYKTLLKTDITVIEKSFQMKLDWELLRVNILKTLTNNFNTMLNSQTKYFEDDYNRKVGNLGFVRIKKKIENSYLKKLGQKVKGIIETDKSRLQNTVNDAFERGLTQAQTVLEVQRTLELTSRSRAKKIAVTEQGKLTSDIDYETAIEVEMDKKTWIHTGIASVSRENHLKLNGKTINFNELFDLGNGNFARYPHDERLPAKEVINCYCMVIYE